MGCVMLRHIRELWWLWLAGMLSIFSGSNFLEFNAMEIFASFAIVLGVLWAIKRHYSEKARKNRLVFFPDTWKAIRRLDQQILEVIVDADVLLPHYACDIKLTAKYDVKMDSATEWESVDLVRPTASQHRGRWRKIAKVSLSSLPHGVEELKEITVWVEVVLDGDFRKKSKRRIVSITSTGVAPSNPDKKDSQP